MAGHSHWANIQHKKSIEDKKRSALFSAISKEIAIAVKEGGPKPENNNRLEAAIEKAKKANMPKEKIERAINRALGIGEEGKLEEVLYEVYGPNGSAFLVEVATDNKNRSTSELKHLVDSWGGSFAQAGAVKWMFDFVGFIGAQIPVGVSEDEIELKLIDLSVQDYKKEKNGIKIYTDAQMLNETIKELKSIGVHIQETALIWKPKNPIKISNEEIKKNILSFEDQLKYYPDTERVFSNIER